MSDQFRMEVKLWGVRGSLPTPLVSHLGYGGNTACVEIRLPGDRSIILDAGTGIRALGQRMAAEANRDRRIDVFLTHFHWDHIAGLPFFAPLFQPDRLVRFHAAGNWGPIETILRAQMAPPYFPVSYERAAARKEYVELELRPLKLDEVTITPFPLNHPQGALGFRIEAGGAVVVFATDFEHGDAKLDDTIRESSRHADILICDAQYTPEEYPKFRGWGHTTWTEAVRIAQDVHARKLVLFHHDPSHTDAHLNHMAAAARKQFEHTEAAREGSVLRL